MTTKDEAPVLEGVPITLRSTRRFSPVRRHRPFGIAGDWHRLPLRVRAPHRGLRCMGNLLCMGLILRFRAIPTPRGLDHADDSLPASMDMDVLDRDLLLALAAVAVERFEQRGVGAGKLVRLVRGSRAGPRRSVRRSWRAGSIPSRRCGRRSVAPPSCLRVRPSGRSRTARQRWR